MKKAYLGIDIGSVSTKGVIIDYNNHIIASSYLFNNEDLVKTTKKIIEELSKKIDLKKYKIVSIGTTGVGRKLIGNVINADIIKNEIISHTIGTTTLYPKVKTIFEIGGEDSKVIYLKNKNIIGYDTNNACSSGIGKFIHLELKKLGIDLKETEKLSFDSKIIPEFIIQCIATSEYNFNLQNNYNKEDIIGGLYRAIVNNYLKNVVKNNKIETPIVFQGGVSKNIGITKMFEEVTTKKIIVNSNSHLMGAFGIAILAKKSKIERKKPFNNINYEYQEENIKAYNI